MSPKNWLFLLVLYLLYLFFGMWIFQNLECPYELKQREAEMVKAIAAHRDLEIIRAALDINNEKMLDKLFVTLHSDLYPFYRMVWGNDTYSSNGFYTNLKNQTDCEKWDFYNSFFFSFTAVTTIGYGHIYPETWEGRLVCIFYCLVGVPLNLLVIGTLGSFFSIKAIKLKKKFSEYSSGMKWELESLHVVSRIILEGTCWIVLGTLLFMVLPATVFYLVEGKKGLDFDGHGRWDYIDTLYYTFITLSTIGFGDMVAAKQMSKSATEEYKEAGLRTVEMVIYNVFIIMWILLGMGYILMIVNIISHAIQSTGKPMKKAIRSLKDQIHVSDYWRNIIEELMIIKNRQEDGSTGSLINGIVSVESDPCLRDVAVIDANTTRKVKSTGDLSNEAESQPVAAKISIQEDFHSLHIPDTIQELNEDTIHSLREFLVAARLGTGPGCNTTSSSATSTRPVSRQPSRPVSRQPSNKSLFALPRVRHSSMSRKRNAEAKDQPDINHPSTVFGVSSTRISRANSNISSRSGGNHKVHQNGQIGHLLEQTTLAQFLEAAEMVRKRSNVELSALKLEENLKPPRKLSRSISREETYTITQLSSMMASLTNKDRYGPLMQDSPASATSNTSVSDFSYQSWAPLGRFERRQSMPASSENWNNVNRPVSLNPSSEDGVDKIVGVAAVDKDNPMVIVKENL